MANTIQNTSLPFLSDYVDITCALINAYQCPAVKNIENGKEIAIKMRQMWKSENPLQQRLARHTSEASLHWTKQNAVHCNFPSLSEENVHHLTFGRKIVSLQ